MKLFNPTAGVNPDILDTIENERIGSHDLISITYHDFVCSAGNPSQEPIFGIIRISYIAGPYLLERDSLELYLTSFQRARYNHLQEANKVIHDDINNLISPLFLMVQSKQDTRGSLITQMPSYSVNDMRYGAIISQDPVTLSNNLTTMRPFNLVNKCPTLHKPNVGKLFISYIMRSDVIYQNDVANYLAGFWNTELYYEDCVHDWRQRLMIDYDPMYLEVVGLFNQRGGTSMAVYANSDSDDLDPNLSRYKDWLDDF